MQVERRADPDGQTLGWMLDDGRGARVWCGELERAEFLDLPREQRIGLRDDLGWYLVEITGDRPACRRSVLARVCDEVTGLKLARAYLLGSRGADSPDLLTAAVCQEVAIAGGEPILAEI